MKRPAKRAQPWLGTFVEISIADSPGDATLHATFDAAFADIARLHRLMSFHAPDSDVARINRAAAGEVVEIDAATGDVIGHALDLSAASEGVFDIACAAKLVEWGYLPHPLPHPPPHSHGCNTALAAGDVLALEDERHVRKLRAGWIDLGGIAKGYVVDAAIGILRCRGMTSACVNAGGDLRVLGKQAYEVAIRDPRAPTSLTMRMPLADAALATSGIYFTRRQSDGQRRSTLIDGRSGLPVTHDISVSVQASTCMTADALTKIVAATGDAHHPLLARYTACALII